MGVGGRVEGGGGEVCVGGRGGEQDVVFDIHV